MAKGYYTPTEAARILRKSDRTIRRMLENGELEGERSSTGRWRLSAQSVEDRRLHDRRMALANTSPETLQELTDQLIETSIELGRTQAKLHMAEQRIAELERALASKG
jgi:excisionase family DNA binding protein